VKSNFLVIDPTERLDVLKGLASDVRIQILKLLHSGPRNVNDIAGELRLPQSTVSANVQILEDAGLLRSISQKARKGSQKICHSTFQEILVMFRDDIAPLKESDIEVAMPLGLYTGFEVTAPCGMCSPTGIIGLLDVPATFLDPNRMSAALVWFTRGHIEYQFPNNARLSKRQVSSVSVSFEVSSEVPGTSRNWPSDVTIWLNGIEIGTWTSPGDFGDQRGQFTPQWWKLEGSQYGMLKNWTVSDEGTFIDGMKLSDVTIGDLDLDAHHSIRLRIGIREDAHHPGGINLFGRGFGNYDQDIILRITTRD
jgi:predicted transcriptional regulator